MDDFAAMRAQGPFWTSTIPDTLGLMGGDVGFHAVPETFDVRRNPNPHVGFGGPGPHLCLGAHLARRELAVAWRQLLTRLPDLEAVGPPEYLEAAGIPLVGGIKRYPVRVHAHGPRRPFGVS